ncbi:MAG: hypothetical protein H0W09_03330 [Solirubrobacterales bacterium]|nr:hypothetical protein [Solirubrobacterales bacterium]
MPPGLQQAPSERARLAQVALGAALGHPNVTGAIGGGSFVTTYGETRLEGVSATAVGGDRFSVGLRLRVTMTPLRPLADELRDRIERAAAAAGRGALLAGIEIEFADLVEPGRPDAVGARA